MSKEINLLHSKKPSVFSILTLKLHLLRIMSLAILSIVTISSVILFIFVFASPLPKLKVEENSLTNSIRSQDMDITKYSLLNLRLGEIKTFINKRMSMGDLISFFKIGLPKDVSIKSFIVKDNSVTLSLSSYSLTSLEEYLEVLKKNVIETKKIKNLKINAISFSVDGYELGLIIKL